jgi:S1-C subfamily serine protease
LLESVIPTSVNIRAEIPEAHPSAQILGTERTGSGTLIDSVGIVLTVNYIVLGAQQLSVTLVDDTTVIGEIAAQDFYSGLAAVRITGTGYPSVPTRRSSEVHVGEEIFILSSAGGAQRRVNTGAVAALAPFDAFWEYHLERSIITTAMNPGLGGGALFARSGHLIGIVSLDLNEVGRFTLAVPIEDFLDYREELLLHGRRTTRPARAWAGFYCYELRDHVVVAGVLPGAPSERAGLKVGDVILGVDGTKINERRDLYRCLWARKPGDEVVLKIFRQNAVSQISLRAGDAEKFFA